MNPRPPPAPPYPALVRRPQGAFGWLDARLLHEGWLARAGPEATALLVLLALAADRRGASYYSRERMAGLLRLPRAELDQALDRLQELGLVARRPWRPGHADGVWQLLPLPDCSRQGPRTRRLVRLSDILRQLGLPR